MNQLIGLIRLQQIDTRLDQIQARLNQIKLILEDKKSVQEIEMQKNATELKLSKIKNELTENEHAVEKQHIKIQQLQSNLYSGKVLNPKELQELEADIGSLKRQLGSNENKLIEFMINCEELQKECEAINLNLVSAQKSTESKNSVVLIEQNVLLKEIEKLNSEKKAAEISLTEEDLVLYYKLRAQRGGIALSMISEDSCSSCGATITPAQHQAVRALDHKIFCPSCGRILYTS